MSPVEKDSTATKSTIASQEPLSPDLIANFPSTRYQGSKAKLVDWTWDTVSDIVTGRKANGREDQRHNQVVQ